MPGHSEKENLYKIIENIVKEIHEKDEISINPMTSDEKKAIRLLLMHNVILMGTRPDQEVLFPGEQFNSLLNQEPKNFFSKKQNRGNNKIKKKKSIEGQAILTLEKILIGFITVFLLYLLYLLFKVDFSQYH